MVPDFPRRDGGRSAVNLPVGFLKAAVFRSAHSCDGLRGRQVLNERHAGVVVRMVIYGSKARGDAHTDSDLDVLIIVRNDSGALKRTLRDIGYDLAATS